MKKSNLLKMLNAMNDSKIGKIEMFLSPLNVPTTNLIMNGQTVQRVDYSELAGVIEENPELYPDFVVTETQITLPNWEGYYLKFASSELGVKKPDTMRKIVGSFSSMASDGNNHLPIASDERSGAFQNNSKDGFYAQATESTVIGGIAFDSSLGVEGQEGIQSPNVGSITEPQNIGVIFTIKAKAEINLDGLVFEDITDFTETTDLSAKFFVLDNGEKISLESLKGLLG